VTHNLLALASPATNHAQAPLSAPAPFKPTNKPLIVGIGAVALTPAWAVSAADVAGQLLPLSGELPHASLTNL
jgi:hypothetical protein